MSIVLLESVNDECFQLYLGYYYITDRRWYRMDGFGRRIQDCRQRQGMKQEELAEMDFKTTAGGGMVEVTISGKKELKELIQKVEEGRL